MAGSERPELRYNPSLDGIRAFAVLAVIASHEATWLPGGFYGVDTFFVLSGFLITSLLVTEWSGSGGIALLRFWGRRARRLLPALFVLVAVVGLVAAVWPATLGAPHLLSDGVTTLFYSANWYLVSQHVGYFEAIAHPSPLLHTWSLAIEEQFYLVWPLVVLAVLRRWRRNATPPTQRQLLRFRRRRLTVLFGVSAVGAVVSAALMAAISPAGGAVSEHAYYGTDTRMQGLLVGAALAIGFTLWGPATRTATRRAFGATALAGAAALVLLWVWVPETSDLAFHGGFFLAALATAAVIAGTVQASNGAVARVLALTPLRALGRVSYGVYLWYWPVLLVVTGARFGVSGNLLMLVRIAVTVALATVSYVFVERPIRHGAFPGWRAAVAAPVGMAAGVFAMLAASLVPAAAAAPATTVVYRPPYGHSAAVSHLSQTVHQRPLKVLLVGDSVAGSLGVGLGAAAPYFGVQMVNEGVPGCSLSMQTSIKVLWYTVAPSPPCTDDQLLSTWQGWVDAYNPDVVVYLARGELFDQQIGGAWSNVLRSSFDTYLQRRFRQAVAVLGSRGASVVLMTTPVYDSGEQETGAPWPEDDPARAAADNAVIERVHGIAPRADGPGVSVFPLAQMLTPGDQYRDVVDSVTTRCDDGVHFTAAAGEWLAPHLFPELVRLGADHRAGAPNGAWPGAVPPPTPGWWQKLAC